MKRFPHVDPHPCGYVLCENMIPGGPVRSDRKYCSTVCSKTARKSLTTNVFNVNNGYVRVAGPMVSGHSVFSTLGRWNRLHVIIAYDMYGAGPHQCHWCSTDIEWLFSKKHDAELNGKKIVVDHVNGVTIDNRSENLVLSCNWCNLHRGKNHMPV